MAKVIQEVECPNVDCLAEVDITTDDIRYPGSATYTTVCPKCGGTVEWTDEGDG